MPPIGWRPRVQSNSVIRPGPGGPGARLAFMAHAYMFRQINRTDMDNVSQKPANEMGGAAMNLSEEGRRKFPDRSRELVWVEPTDYFGPKR